jgi:branched-chain amino acid aminotransferase
MFEPMCFLDGALVPLKEARVGVNDLGLLRSFAIYEGITAIKGEPFHFHDHFERFTSSARALGLTLPVTEPEALVATRKVVAHNAPGAVRASIRMLLTGGEAESGIEHAKGREIFYITAEEAVPYPAEVFERGASLITHEHLRFMPEYKTTNYITAVVLQPKRKEAGAIEILYVHGDTVLECATSNIFIVKSGAVITPERDILKGITRKVILDLARSAYPVETREVTAGELARADEVFITSSFKDIVPITSIDDKKAGNGTVGPITRDLMGRFAKSLVV